MRCANLAPTMTVMELVRSALSESSARSPFQAIERLPISKLALMALMPPKAASSALSASPVTIALKLLTVGPREVFALMEPSS